MQHNFFRVLIFIGLFYATGISGQAIDQDKLEVNIDAMVPSHVNDTTPGLVVGVVQNGKLIFSKGYGLANMSYGISNDPTMVYNIGSVSKQFLGYAFAMLHVEGKLNIDDPVGKYLEDWPEFEQQVTLRNLLTHTSGYREAYTMSNLAGRIIGVDHLSREECLKVVRKQPNLEFIPGSRYTYNSTAWVILAEVFKKVTGEPAAKWVESNILIPLGMENTQIETYVGEVMQNAAESYSYNDDQGYENYKSNRAIFGAAEIFSSIHDLTKWVNNYRTPTVGGMEVNSLFLKSFILNDGTNSEYALGIGIGLYRGLKRYRHTGGHAAFQTQLSYYPDQDIGIIVISNFGGKGWLPTTKIAELLLEDQMNSPEDFENERINIKKDELEQFTGVYLASTINRTIELSIKDGSLTIEGQTKLIPTHPNTFRIADWEGKIKFETTPNGENQLTSSSSNSKDIYKRIEAWIPSVNDLKSFEGDYWSNEIETVYHINVKNEKLTIQHRWLGDIIMEPITQDLFKSDWGYFVKFIRNKEGDISALSINSGRTLNVLFQRKK